MWRRRASGGVWRFRARVALLVLLAAGVFAIKGCTTAPPVQQANLCEVLEERRGWYRAAARSERRWGVPVAVQMAFVQQESSFRARARPPRKKLFGFVPWRRPSSAYGYAQATDPTWEAYLKDRGRPWFKDRHDFDDAVDFIGWYNRRSHRQLGIPLTDAYRLYLAYHEGPAGYRRGSYQRKPNVKRYAERVRNRAAAYQRQLNGCRDQFERWGWLPFV